MKKILKLTLSLLCILSITGCSSKASGNNTIDRNDTKVIEKKEKTNRKSKYFKNLNEDYTLRNSLYGINVQDDSTIKHSLTADYFIVTDNNNSKLKILINSSIKNDISSLQDIKSTFNLNREDVLMDLYDYSRVTLNKPRAQSPSSKRSEGRGLARQNKQK